MYGEEVDEYDEDDFVFNEYAIDDTLDSLTRLEKYHDSDFSLQRLVLAKELPEIAQESGYEESSSRLLPLLANFVSDSEPAVRQVFAEVLPELAKFFVQHGEESGYHELIRTYIPYAFELIIDKNAEVGQAATVALSKISELLRKEHVEPQILSVVVNLAHDDRVEDYRIVAAQLCNELAGVFGEKLCSEVVVKEILLLSDDVSFSVRKTVAQNLGKICQTIGVENTVHSVLPIFLTLSKDEIWGVRKACAESLVSISQFVTSEVRKTQLYDVFERFAEDVSRWVRISAFQHLGPFLATFPAEDVSDNLIQFFTEMAFQKENSNDSDMAEHCAFNFPAVVTTVKRDKWPDLEEAYMTLVKDVQWKVRRSLACSLHEVAQVLGTEITESTLTSAFELFLRDLDEVKVGVVENIAKFLAVLGSQERSKYLPIVCTIPRETDNWRIRKEIANQLGDLAVLVSPSDVKETVAKLAMHLMDDSVADVRSTAVTSAGKILKRLAEGKEEEKIEFLDYLLSLAQADTYYKRQMFIFSCNSIANEVDANLFETKFLPELLALSDDRVANIRIAIAKLLADSLLVNANLKDNKDVILLKEKMSQDKDRDVIYYLSQVKNNNTNNNSNNNNNNNNNNTTTTAPAAAPESSDSNNNNNTTETTTTNNAETKTESSTTEKVVVEESVTETTTTNTNSEATEASEQNQDVATGSVSSSNDTDMKDVQNNTDNSTQESTNQSSTPSDEQN